MINFILGYGVGQVVTVLGLYMLYNWKESQKCAETVTDYTNNYSNNQRKCTDYGNESPDFMENFDTSASQRQN